MRQYVGDGTLAEYVTIPVTIGLARIPGGLDPSTAGALGLAGTAASASIDAVSPAEGETVLIGGATGGVGAIANSAGGRSRRRGDRNRAPRRGGRLRRWQPWQVGSHRRGVMRNSPPPPRSIAKPFLSVWQALPIWPDHTRRPPGSSFLDRGATPCGAPELRKGSDRNLNEKVNGDLVVSSADCKPGSCKGQRSE